MAEREGGCGLRRVGEGVPGLIVEKVDQGAEREQLVAASAWILRFVVGGYLVAAACSTGEELGYFGRHQHICYRGRGN